MPMSSDRDLSVAIRTVADACGVARTVQRDLNRVRQIAKDDKSPVTVADFAVQAIVAMDLADALGPSLVVGEESSGQLRSPDQAAVLAAVVNAVQTQHPRANANDVLSAIDACNHDATGPAYWTLDPIDGTKGFLRGQQYAIALALIEHGQVVLGVMGCPNLSLDQYAPLDQADSRGAIYAASLGGGAWEIDSEDQSARRRIHSARFEPRSPIRACESVEAGHSKQDETARILRELGEAGTPARLDSQCKYAVVARGQADAYLRIPTGKGYVEKIWDHAAGAIIAVEAGAGVSDIAGAPLDFTRGRRLEANRGIVCAAAGLHERIIAVIARLGISAAATQSFCQAARNSPA